MLLRVRRSTGKARFLRPTPKIECPINFNAPLGRWKGFSSVAFSRFDLGSSKNHSCPLTAYCGSNNPSQRFQHPFAFNPPAGYDYKWSAD